MQFLKNQQIQLEITDLNTDGDGIGKVNGFPFFVKDTVPGDVITATVMKVKKITAMPECKVFFHLRPTEWNRSAHSTRPAEGASFRRFPMRSRWSLRKKRSLITCSASEG